MIFERTLMDFEEDESSILSYRMYTKLYVDDSGYHDDLSNKKTVVGRHGPFVMGEGGYMGIEPFENHFIMMSCWDEEKI